jgi:hypothetical protein
MAAPFASGYFHNAVNGLKKNVRLNKHPHVWNAPENDSEKRVKFVRHHTL